MKNCIKCGINIPQERLDVIPTTETCVNCSDIETLVGITVWNKTTPELIIVDKKTAEKFWKLEKYDGHMSRF